MVSDSSMTPTRYLAVIMGVLLLSALSKSAIATENARPVNEPAKLNLERAVSIAITNNSELQQAKVSAVSDKYNMVTARKEFMPQYQFNADSELSDDNKVKSTIRPAINLKTYIGTQFSLEHSEGLGEKRDGKSDLTVTQPLLRGFGYSANKADLDNARDTLHVAKLDFENQVIQTVTNVAKQYRRVLTDFENLKVNKQGYKKSKQELEKMKKLVEAGRKPLRDLTSQRSQVQNRHLQILEAKNTYQNDKKQLMDQLNLKSDPDMNLNPDIRVNDIELPSKEKSYQIALEHNIAYQKALINYRQTKRRVNSAWNNNLWQLDLTGKLPIEQQGRGDTTGKSIGANLSIPIDDVNRRQGLVNARIQKQNTETRLAQQKREIYNDVASRLTDIHLLRRQIKADKKAVELAREAYETSLVKYEHGRVSNFETTSRHTDLLNAQKQLFNDKLQFLNSVDDFYAKLGTELERWRIDIDY